jgi:dTDP-4-dehydrorhamnose reductase
MLYSAGYISTMAKKILITGASGFLGQHLVHGLLSRNSDTIHYEIVALYNSMKGFAEAVKTTTKQKDEAQTGIHTEPLDLTDAGAIESFLKAHGPFDMCLHLAALSSPRVCENEPDKARALNVPTHFFDALASSSTPIVALSTDQVYGGTKGTPYTEEDTTEPLNVYAKTKVEMEQYVLNNMNTKSGVVLLRSSILLGPKAPIYPEGAHDTFLHFCAGRAKGQPTTYFTDECRSVIAVSDVVGILTHFCRHPPSQETTIVYNMGGPARVSRFDMAKAVQHDLGVLGDEDVVPAVKSTLPPGSVLSPLDIAMSSAKLQALVGFEFLELVDIVKVTLS